MEGMIFLVIVFAVIAALTGMTLPLLIFVPFEEPYRLLYPLVQLHLFP